MDPRHRTDPGRRAREQRGSHRRRTPLLAVLTLLILACLLGAAVPAAATSGREAAPPLLARLALQQAELTAGDGVAFDSFGRAVALSGDTALVGAPYHGASAGAVYVFARVAGVWTQQAKLVAADAGGGGDFGSAVALSGDTALVGAPNRDPGDKPSAGAAFVFVRANGVWTQQAKLVAADAAAFDSFGGAVALAGDTALVGAPSHAVAGKAESGAAYVFTRAAGVWNARAELTAGDGAAYDWFGGAVALSGGTALVGAHGHDVEGKADAGAAYVFVRADGTWKQSAQLLAGDGAAHDRFGGAVALSGETALVGASDHAAAGKYHAGAVYVFTRSGGVWKQQQALRAGDAADFDYVFGSFGGSVALDGKTALIGAVRVDSAGRALAGAAYVFTRSGDSWTQRAKLIAADAGWSVALSAGTALVGAPSVTVADKAEAGAAYIFVLPTVRGFTPAAGRTGTLVTVTGSGFTGVTEVTFNGIPASYTVVSDEQLTATVPRRATSGPIAVTTASGGGGSATRFTVRARINRLTPTTCRRGARVVITGSGFGARRAGGVVRFGAMRCAEYLSWSTTRITCRVPAGAKFGRLRVRVTTAAGASNRKGFTVKR